MRRPVYFGEPRAEEIVASDEIATEEASGGILGGLTGLFDGILGGGSNSLIWIIVIIAIVFLFSGKGLGFGYSVDD